MFGQKANVKLFTNATAYACTGKAFRMTITTVAVGSMTED